MHIMRFNSFALLFAATVAHAEDDKSASHIPYCVVDGDDAACPLGALGTSPPSADGVRVRAFSELPAGSAAEMELSTADQRDTLKSNL